MNFRTKTALSATLIVATFGLAVPANAAGKSPIVVELFTSQGCSSCPPANANLIKLTDRDDILALSFAVTYWDRLGLEGHVRADGVHGPSGDL